jgi:hypothetical protein
MRYLPMRHLSFLFVFFGIRVCLSARTSSPRDRLAKPLVVLRFHTYNRPRYPREKQPQIENALVEAWAWLEAQGLLVPAGDTSGRNGWRVLSRRAQKIQTEAEFASHKVARLLPKELLHPKIADAVWGGFMRGEFDSAAFQAMKGVEVAVRTAAGLGAELIGVKLMRTAFAPDMAHLRT